MPSWLRAKSQRIAKIFRAWREKQTERQNFSATQFDVDAARQQKHWLEGEIIKIGKTNRCIRDFLSDPAGTSTYTMAEGTKPPEILIQESLAMVHVQTLETLLERFRSLRKALQFINEFEQKERQLGIREIKSVKKSANKLREEAVDLYQSHAKPLDYCRWVIEALEKIVEAKRR